MKMSSCFNRRRFGVVAVCLLVILAGLVPAWTEEKKPAATDPQPPAIEKLPAGAKIVRIEAAPDAIHLKNPYEYRQLLVTAHLESGDKIDVTRLAQIEKPVNLVDVNARGLVRPTQDGMGAIKVSIEGQSLSLPVQVTGFKDKVTVSFVRDVMPTMSKMGCNAGTCHGAQQGRNGFKLSLRGYDPLYDHQALTDDVEGRRFNRAAPDRSLMLLKPAGAVPHVGSVLTKPGEPYYELLRAWIADGVKLDLTSPRVVGIDVSPKVAVLPLIGMKQQIAVMATYSDGSVRDVSAESFVDSSNTEVATVDKQGLVAAIRRGEATMLARYEGSYAAATLLVMGDRSGFEWKDAPVNNYIDTLVYGKLKKIKVQPSDICTDAEFIRRIYLDLTGLPPQPEEVQAFLADNRPTQAKRDALVHKLVGSPDFIEHWTNKWADLLQVNRKFLGEAGAKALREWIRKAVVDNMPYDKFVYEILTASGSTMEKPPAAYHKILRDPGLEMENTTQLFLATRFNCNKCHDHPFERWTQDQYYQTAAFFAQIERKEDPKYKGQKVGATNVEAAVPLVEIISDATAGDVKHERTGAITPPKFPYKHDDLAPPTAPRREQLAKWITSPKNQYFAKSFANRLWSYLLGVGIIEPVDDIRAGNPPSNPELLDKLTQEFVASGFNTRQLITTICKSRTYQHSIVTNKWNEGDEINYSHAIARRLPAEVLYDAVHRVTGATTKLPGLPPGARAAQLLDSNVDIPSGFLDLFGKPPRESACECERSGTMMLGPVLNLVNGPIIADAVKDPENRISKLIATEPDNAKVVKNLFMAILCREPTPQELEAGIQAIGSAEQEHARLVVEYFKRSEAIAAYEKTLPPKQMAWEKETKDSLVTWTVLEPETFTATEGVKLEKQMDKSILATGPLPDTVTYTVTAKTKLTGITGIRLEVLADKRLPSRGPGRNLGNFTLDELTITAAPEGKPAEAKPVALHNAVADFSQEGLPVQYVIDGSLQTTWGIFPQTGKNHVAAFECKEPVNVAGGTSFTFKLEQGNLAKKFTLGKFRLSVTTNKPPLKLKMPPESIVQVLMVEADKRTDAQKTTLDRYYRSQDAELAKLQKYSSEFPKPPVDPRAVGAQDLTWALLNSPAFLFNH